VIKAQFAIPGDIGTPTGGYVYDRQVMAVLPPSWRRLGGCSRPSRRIAPC
jgi:hypothetical protein